MATNAHHPELAVVKQLDDERTLWRALVRMHGDVVQYLERELQSVTGLSVQAFEALYELTEAPEQRLQLSQLADRLGVTRGAVTRLVDRLETAGYVERLAHAHDRRRVHASLMPAGEAIVDESRELYAHALHYALLRHRSLDGLVVYTSGERGVAHGTGPGPSWYRVQFGA